MNKILFKKDDFYSFIFSLFMIFYLNPVAWGDAAITLLKIFSMLIVFFTLCFYKDVLFLNIKSSLIFILSCLSIIILCIIFGKIVSAVNYTVIIFLLIVFLKKEIIYNILRKFSILYSILVGVGLLIYITTFLTQLPSVYQEASSMKIGFGISYNNYFNLLLMMKGDLFNNGFLYRFQSVFDEPGVVGTISGLLLLTRVKEKLNVITFVIIISGLLSLSFAFFIFCFLWVILSFNKKIVLLISFLIVFMSVFFYLIEFSYLNEFINWLQVRNNRVSSCFMSSFYSNFFNHIYFGLGDGATANLQCDVSSAFTYLYDYGSVGFLLFIYSLYTYIVYMIVDNNRNSKVDFLMLIFILIISLLNLYQRPDFFSPVYLILYLCLRKCKNEEIEK